MFYLIVIFPLMFMSSCYGVSLSHSVMGWSVIVAFSVHTHQVLAMVLDSYFKSP